MTPAPSPSAGSPGPEKASAEHRAPHGAADSTAAGLPDLASRSYGGSVVAASDESFAERQALILPGRPGFRPGTFGARGQVYDGWETRRRRDDGHDWALVRLGMPGVVRHVVIDTAWFTGNYPPYASVGACAAEGHPSPDELLAAAWTEIVPRVRLSGDAAHGFPVADPRRYTHVRLNIFPDGGVARLRVHGEVVPDPALLAGLTIDLAALENGALVTGCSDDFYSSPVNVIAPGLPRHQAEGWETARRRDGGNDWLTVRLAVPGVIQVAELDTTNLVYNAPAAASLKGADLRGRATGLHGSGAPGEDEWFELLPLTRLQPDTRHRFRLAAARAATHVRLDIHPDGGLARLRLHGAPVT
ncbi:putative allantoicase [Sphaerisporangium krabiense]|uniref:Probable allantoicase n=1 Tax=Sphaerisporangium krabiense TaxID=763782 RepID=A0A7W9DSJ3_9ACTN|nr:allantoicase [Sphaerisporangium krabiense]MBB5629214.1 allantoicase [Sphaerisporangium krabiense]GII59943.1 putative allantoicase [Sphaerisporangium krabiense]